MNVVNPESIGRYRLVRLLGTGSFATVWLARDEELDAWVAIKVLAENWSYDDGVKQRFLSEARILHRLDNPRFVRVMNVDHLPDGRPYFVMEYADRGSLQERIDERVRDGRPFAVREALAVARELAECLVVAHSLQVVHRDLKPSNLLYRTIPAHLRGHDGQSQSDERMMLADFGLARFLDQRGGYTIAAGTPQYMAPEQASGKADERSDLYSAAAILHHLITGRPPQGGVDPSLSPGLVAALESGLANDPNLRPQSAEQWRDVIDALLSDVGGVGAPATMIAPAVRRRRRAKRRGSLRRVVVRALALGALVGAGVGGYAIWAQVASQDTGSTAPADPPPGTAVALAVGQSMHVELEPGGASHLYSLSGSAGEQLIVTSMSEDSMITLDVFDPEGALAHQASAEVLGELVLVRIDPVVDGRYLVRVSGEGPGRYLLTVVGSAIAVVAGNPDASPQEIQDSTSAQYLGGEGRRSAFSGSLPLWLTTGLIKRTDSTIYPPVISGDLLLVGYADGALSGLRVVRYTQVPYLREEWTWEGSAITGSPAVKADGVLFAPTADGFMSARLADGELLWETDLGTRVSGPILLTDDVVCAIADESTLVVLGFDGVERWRFSVSAGRVVGLAAESGTIVLGTDTGVVVGLNIVSGLSEWRIAAPVGSREIAIDDGRVFITSDSVVTAVSLIDGSPLWTYESAERLTGTVTAGFGMAYAPSSTAVVALNVTLGREAWRFAAVDGVAGQPALVGSKLVIPRLSGDVSVIDAVAGCVPDGCSTVSLFTPSDLSLATTVTVGDGFLVVASDNAIGVFLCAECVSVVGEGSFQR